MSLEDVITTLGGCGRYQRRLFFVISVFEILLPLQLFCQIFYTIPSDHWCTDYTWTGPEACPSHWNLSTEECTDIVKDTVIPSSPGDSPVYSKCTKYRYVNVTGDVEEWLYSNSSVEIVDCNQGWTYEETVKHTVTKDFELVCDRSSLIDISHSVLFAGILTGCVICTLVGDRFGRFYLFYMGMVGAGVTGCITAFVPWFTAFMVLRFITAIFMWIATSSIFTLLMEFTGSSYRVYANMAFALPFGLGYMLLSALAYAIDNWRVLQVVLSLPFIGFLVFWPMLLESPRWLMTNKRWEDAERVLTKLAKLNKTENRLTISEISALKEKFQNETKSLSLLHVLRFRRLRLRSLNLMFVWCVHSLVYYGLTLNSPKFGVSIYVTFCFFGFVEMPASILSMLLMKYVGRRYAVVLCMVPAGVACILTTFLPKGGWMATLAIIGKLCISSSFGSIYLFSVELYSTNVRVAGLGLCSMSSRVGGMFAPLILLLSNLWKPLPLIFFGATSIVSGLLSLMLPETKGTTMPQTIEEAENMGRTKLPLPTSVADDHF